MRFRKGCSSQEVPTATALLVEPPELRSGAPQCAVESLAQRVSYTGGRIMESGKLHPGAR